MDDATLFTNSQDSGSNNATYSYTGSGAYKSPWNIDSLRRVQYTFDSNGANWDGVYVRITPYIGLAYYDGNDNGTYNTPSGTFNLANGNYPNLYANGQEYGDYVQANPIILASQMLTGVGGWYTHELWIQSDEDHCPLVNIPVGINYNLYSLGFDIVNNATIQPTTVLGGATLTSPPPAGTADEERLLREYGKVFYYKIEYVSDANNFSPDAYYVLALEADLSDLEWTDLSLTDNPFIADLLYHDNGGIGSKEIVVDPDSFRDIQPEYKRSGEWFETPFGRRRIRTYANSYLMQTTWGSIIPGAEPKGVAIYFD